MTFTPDRSTITNITQAIPAVVTTAVSHGLFTGNVARLNVPRAYGMFPLNNLAVQVTVLSPTTFSCWYSLSPSSVPVDSREFPAFVTPTNPGFLASVIPIGSGATPSNEVNWQTLSGFCDTPLTDSVLNNSVTPIPF